MIQPLCPPVRCYLTASYLLSSFPDAGSPHLHTPSFVGSLVEEELLSSTTTTTTVFLRLCSPRGWINCCVFDIHSLSGPGRRRRDERIKRKVTERLVLSCQNFSSIPRVPPRILFLRPDVPFSPSFAEKVDIVLQATMFLLSFRCRESGNERTEERTPRTCFFVHLEFVYADISFRHDWYSTISLRDAVRFLTLQFHPDERYKFTNEEKERERVFCSIYGINEKRSNTLEIHTRYSNKVEQLDRAMARVVYPATRSTDAFRARHKCRKFGRKSVSRQITVNRGVIVKQRDLVETWLREATFTGVGEEIAVQDQLLSFLCVSSQPSRSA